MRAFASRSADQLDLDEVRCITDGDLRCHRAP